MGARNRWSLAVSAAALFSALGQATAQTPAPLPPPPAAAADEEEEDTIIVTAPESEVRIDRRTYTVRDDPAAQATEALDILGRIPSVSVAPTGAIRLLGGTDVAVQLNGQPIPPDSVEQVLRTLTGGEIERIEVITNPPASQSAAASAGIINIITRQRTISGWSGSLLGIIDTLGSSQLSVAPAWTDGPWSISGRVTYINNKGTGGFTRDTNNLNTGVNIHEEGDSEYDNRQNAANLQLGYRFDPRRRVSVTFDRFAADNEFRQSFAQFVNAAPANVQDAFFTNEFANGRAYLNYQQTGADQSLLKLTGFLMNIDGSNERLATITPTSGGPTQTLSINTQENLLGNLKLDFEQPLGPQRLLTLGASFEQSDQDIGSSRETIGAPGPADYISDIEGVERTAALYGTLQFPTGDWIWQPGLRAENYQRDLTATGGDTEAEETMLFPSVHVRRRLSPQLDINLSYSSRIQRPYFFQLDPTVRLSPDGSKGNSGNPNLEPTTTDAFEANLTYQNRGSTISITAFDRISQDVVTQFTELTPGGVLLTTFVNAGESEQRGLEAVLRGPLWENWRYSASVNLLNRDFDVLRNGALTQRSEFEYGGNAQIEYRDANQDRPGANHYQFDVQFQGPRATLQGETDEYVMANFTWRRRLTERVFGTILWADVFDSNTTETTTFTGDVFDHLENRGVEPRVRFSLTYQFGSLTARPPQQDQPPPMGGPPPQ